MVGIWSFSTRDGLRVDAAHQYAPPVVKLAKKQKPRANSYPG